MMNKLLKISMFCYFSCFWGVGFAASDLQPFTDLNRPIIVASSQPQTTIYLPSNASTGFQWILVGYDHDLVEPISRHYESPKNAAMGAMGRDAWQFKLKKTAFLVPQQTTIVLEYKRPWEISVAQQQKIQLITEPTLETHS